MARNVGVILCRCSGAIARKIDFRVLEEYLSGLEGVKSVLIVDKLCRDKTLESVKIFIKNENITCLVIAGCTDVEVVDYVRDTLKTLIDPFSCEFVNLREECAEFSGNREILTERAKLLIKAYVEKVKAGSPRVTGGNRLIFSLPRRPIDRRHFLRILLPDKWGQLEIPAVDCKQENCMLCTVACPFNALRFENGILSLAVNDCTGCGLCASICPYGYIQMPTFSDEQAYALIGALADPAFKIADRVLVFTCDKGHARVVEAIRKGWRPRPSLFFIRVPCIATLTYTLLMRGLELGFNALFLLCADNKCPNKTAICEAERTARSINELSCTIGLKPRVSVIRIETHGEDISEVIEKAIDRIAVQYGQNGLNEPPTQLINERRKDFVNMLKNILKNASKASCTVLKGLNLPFFEVTIDESRCNMCLACVNICPTGALTLEKGKETASIVFNYLNCIGCNMCVEKCPYSAVKIERSLDVLKLIQGKLEEKKE